MISFFCFSWRNWNTKELNCSSGSFSPSLFIALPNCCFKAVTYVGWEFNILHSSFCYFAFVDLCLSSLISIFTDALLECDVSRG